jgi:hypothetical protein
MVQTGSQLTGGLCGTRAACWSNSHLKRMPVGSCGNVEACPPLQVHQGGQVQPWNQHSPLLPQHHKDPKGVLAHSSPPWNAPIPCTNAWGQSPPLDLAKSTKVAPPRGLPSPPPCSHSTHKAWLACHKAHTPMDVAGTHAHTHAHVPLPKSHMPLGSPHQEEKVE